MRSTSSGCSRGIAALLALSLLAPPGGARAEGAAPASSRGEGAVLLRYASPSLDPGLAAGAGDGLRDALLASVPARWLPPPRRDPPSFLPGGGGGEPSPAELSALAGRIRDAASRMEQAEGAEADGILAGAETEARRLPFGPAVRPYLADIWLRRGILSLWAGDGEAAVRRFAAARTLDPSFRPDPALYPPAVRDAWERASPLAPLRAELVVESVPAGAEIRLDGVPAGRTPARVVVADPGRHRIVLLLAGHRPVFRDGSWLPGDGDSLSLTLPMDPSAAVATLLPREGEGPPPSLSPLLEAVAADAGAERVCLVALEPAPGGGARGRVLAWTRAEGLRDLGHTRSAGGAAEGTEAGRDAARLLAAAGWPATPKEAGGKPWYHRWWFIAAVGAAAAGVAAALSGGGGGGGQSSSGVRINF